MASAKGASLIISLGQRPRNSHNANSSALKAPFIRSVEARLQRWFTFRTKSWGDAPGWNESRAFGAKQTSFLRNALQSYYFGVAIMSEERLGCH